MKSPRNKRNSACDKGMLLLLCWVGDGVSLVAREIVVEALEASSVSEGSGKLSLGRGKR